MALELNTEDTTTLEMALVGYELERQKIESRISEIRAHLGHSTGSAAVKKSTSASSPAKTPAPEAAAPGKKRILSAAARRRIAAAQRKRWAEHRKRAAEAKG